MSTIHDTHDNTAQSWRDLADQLTPEQIAELEWWESRPNIPPRADGAPWSSTQHQGALLFSAREYAGQNAAANRPRGHRAAAGFQRRRAVG